jgi:hypothetical protein
MMSGKEPPALPQSRQITLIGANGSGKTRFMKELIKKCGDKAYCLSALSASFPERKQSTLKGSIDNLYAEAVKKKPYLRTDAMSEIDKLAYMLFTDEFESLLRLKAQHLYNNSPIHNKPTKLDKLIRLWSHIFPNTQIFPDRGQLLFSNESGDDKISAITLSQGEKSVLYYIAATLYAMPNAVIFIESPSLFLHPAILNTLWNAIEELRPDCTFVYNTVDVDFVYSRTENVCIWIKSYDATKGAWDYEVLDSNNLKDTNFIDIIGTRKPVLFIEGDPIHSIDAKLYSLVFSDYTVRPLGSCNKVIESTRTFNDLKTMHHLDSHGIVDRDRRTDIEVDYLRKKNIFVPNVAEVENIFLLEDVIKIMANRRGRDPEKVFNRVKQEILSMFSKQYQSQALQHVRHIVKRDVERKVDAKFTCITALETHLRTLIDKLQPRETYNHLLKEFSTMISTSDYAGVLKVFNHKPMLSECSVTQLLGYGSTDAYIGSVLSALKGMGKDSIMLKACIKQCFNIVNNIETVQLAEKPVIQQVNKLIQKSSDNTLSDNRHYRKKKKRY